MKKDRNCGMNNYPGYVMPLPVMPGMPNITMSPNMGYVPNNSYPSNVTTNVNTNDDEIKMQNEENKKYNFNLAALEGNNSYGNYSSNSYQML